MSDNSDYKKPRTNLIDYLPEVLKTDVNKTFFENVFNRYWTKPELKYVYGTIGKKNIRANKDTRIPEDTIHRQTYQLQPLVYKKIASVEHIMSFYDILNKAEQFGIEKNRLPLWGKTEKFNFAPPIDFEKLVKWEDYFWYDPENPNSKPQYITIKNLCTLAQARLNAKRKDHAELLAKTGVTQEQIALSQAQLDLLERRKNCICGQGSLAWGTTQWDDNPPNWISEINPNEVAPENPNVGDLWYDTNEKKLKYFTGTTWEVYPPSMLSEGMHVWDMTHATYCIQTDDWSKQNKWFHRDDVPNFAIAKRAQMPIIEYNPHLELNNWTYTQHVWAYRGSRFDSWKIVEEHPSLYEMGVKFPLISIQPQKLDVLEDHTQILHAGMTLSVTIDSASYEYVVVGFTYDSNSNITSIDVIGNHFPIITNEKAFVEFLITKTSKGDNWEGFFKHWALVEVKTPVPVNKQKRPSNIVVDTFGPIESSSNLIFVLSDSKRFLANQNSIRVYVNKRRQYGNYEEGFYDNASSSFISVEDPLYIDPNNFTDRDYFSDKTEKTYKGIFGNAIRFTSPVEEGSIITIEIQPAALEDIYLQQIEVRTTIDVDYDFSSFNTSVLSLAKYHLHEQLKTEHTQYPLFDIFNVDGSTVYEANRIFGFEEDQNAPLHPLIQKRIKLTSNKKEYYFEQFLIDEDSGTMFCYKDAWSVDEDNPEGLQTIWRQTKNSPYSTYIPRYVNSYRLADGEQYVDKDGVVQTAHVTSSTGDWELLEQMYYNVHHENRKKIKLSELVSHFGSIIEGQKKPDDILLTYNKNIFHILEKPNFSVGGTIREYNNSFDMFVSAMFQFSENPRKIFEFAQSQYDFCFKILDDNIVRHLADYINDTSDDSILNFEKFVADNVIKLFENNDWLETIFSDTTTYNTKTKKGVKNWIATLPFFRLVFPVEPQLIIDPKLDIMQLLHHDGHISDINLLGIDVKKLFEEIVEKTNGSSDSSKPHWSEARKGQVWLNRNEGKLFRFSVVSTDSVTPSTSFPLGSLWLNQSAGELYFRSDNSPTGWELVPGNDIDVAWKEIDIKQIIAQTRLEVEKRLFEAVEPFDTLAFDFKSLIRIGNNNPAIIQQERETLVKYLTEQFYNYIQQTKINPFEINFLQADPFTWNYNSINVYENCSVYKQTQWASYWKSIYENNFNTSYPHLMPWRLQGYTDKPSWWDTEYKDTTGTRRWKPVMWTNILRGRVPNGRKLPFSYKIGSTVYSIGQNVDNEVRDSQGTIIRYNFVCVNISSTPITIGTKVYNPDDLLPPYIPINTINSSSTQPASPQVGELWYDTNIQKLKMFNGVSWELIKLTFLNDYNTHIYPYISQLNEIPAFGEQGKVEYEWRKSLDFLYSLLHIAFRMQPIKFLHSAFGNTYIHVAGLNIEKQFKKVFSHRDTIFHGEIDENGVVRKFNGLNQWYVNFIRYNGFDINKHDFKQKWVDWDTKLSYQTNSFIDVKSLELSSKYFRVIPHDYEITIKKTLNTSDYWINALLVTTHSIGSWNVYGNNKVPRGDGSDWKFRVDIPSPVNTVIKHYDVKRYNCILNLVNGVLTNNDQKTLPWFYENNAQLDEPHKETLNWDTGTAVQVYSPNGIYPAPLKPNTTYYIIKIDNTSFKLANSFNEAVAEISIDFIGSGTQPIQIEEVRSTFVVNNNQSVKWKHIALDKRHIKETFMPSLFSGVQSLIDLIDGYSSYLKDIGWSFNLSEFTEIDISTEKVLNWQTEIERLISSIYNGLGRITYFQFEESDTTTSLYHEVNPFRNNIWLRTNQGIISNISGSTNSDITINSCFFNQRGEILPERQVFAFRTDSLTHFRHCYLVGSVYGQTGYISTNQNIPTQPYTHSHIAGAHLFVDTYEHVIMFNNRTSENYLIYDPFLGLETEKFYISFQKAVGHTLRPNMGGYYLYNQNMEQNIEYSVETIQNYYDTYQVNETANFLNYARSLLGYKKIPYLDYLNVNSKTNFIFWRGMIQNKGSTNAVKAFINARLFVDAKVDEFWAYKVATYGNVKENKFFDILIKPEDLLKNELRLEFISEGTPHQERTKHIAVDDNTFWDLYPDQKNEIDKELNFYFDAEIIDVKRVSTEEIFSSDVIISNITPGDGIVVCVGRSENERFVLEENQQYQRIDTQTIKIFKSESWWGLFYDTFNWDDDNDSSSCDICPQLYLYIYTYIINKKVHNPAKLIDKKNNNTITPIFIWHPAFNMHFHVPAKQIDLWNKYDPAYYNEDLQLSTQDNSRKCWNSQEVGKIWFKTSSVDYVPYYDSLIFPSFDDRVFYWGKAADWSTFEIYQWTESPVPPLDWEEYVEEQKDNNLIDPHLKPSGNPLRVIYRRINEAENLNEITFGDFEKIENNPRDTIFVSKLPEYCFEETSESGVLELKKIPLRLFEKFHKVDEKRTHTIIPDKTELRFYINGFFKGTVQARCVISETLEQPPSEPQVGNIYFVPDTGAKDVWKGLEGKYVQYIDSQWVVRTPISDNMTTPPVNPDINDLYFVPFTGKGDWQGKEGKYVEWDGINWNVINVIDNYSSLNPPSTPGIGDVYLVPKSKGLWNNLHGKYVQWNGVSWVIRILLSNTLTTPPSNPRFGDFYYVPSGASGVWSSFVNKYVEWNGSTWQEIQLLDDSSLEPPAEPMIGDVYYIPKATGDWEGKEGKYVKWSGSMWIERVLVDDSLTEPPADPDIGNLYYIPGATGDWEGKEGNYVEWNGTSWDIVPIVSDSLIEPPSSASYGLYFIPDKGPTGDWKNPELRGHFVEWNGATWEKVSEDTETALLADDFENYPGGCFVDLETLNIRVRICDIITIELPLYQIEINTLNNSTVEFSEFFPYTQIITYDNVGNVRDTKYYFWVTNKDNKASKDDISIKQIKSLLQHPSLPYMFMLGFESITPTNKFCPRFSQVVIRGISRYISEENRYKIRFQVNNSLRDETNISTSLTSKNLHSEWKLIRKEQPYKISKYLWDKLTESVMGCKINNYSVSVPSLDRVEFDKINNTATRIGFEEGQTMVDKEIALKTIIAEIERTDYDLYPVDKNKFLNTYKFDTPENVYNAMEYIYYNFSYLDVNRIFFSCLEDALSLKNPYNGIIKTSMIALHGIRLFETKDRVIDD